MIMEDKNKHKKIFLLITGYPGSGKTTIAKILKKKIFKLYGATVLINGDDIRKIFNYNNYSKEGREELDVPYLKIAHFIFKQKVNVILCSVSISDKNRKLFRDKFKFKSIHIITNENSRRLFKKTLYKKNKNLPGIDQTIKKPKEVDIFATNNSKKNIEKLANTLWQKLLIKL